MRPVVSDAMRARVREMHSAGRGRNDIAKELGVAPATVTKIAQALGLDFSRADTATAVAARVRTLKDRRADIVDRLYRRAEANLDRLEAPRFTTLVRAEGGAEYERTLPFVPPEHERALVGTISTALTAASKLRLEDADQSSEDAKSLLSDLGKALGISSAGAES